MKKLIEKLKNHTFHDFYFQIDSDKNITKHVPNNNYFNWECEIYKYLLKNQKFPIALPMTPSKNCFIYQTNKLKPLCELLLLKNRNLILNELFSFVFNLRYSNFVHGNLHIYNIFYDTNSNQFYILNLTDSNELHSNELYSPKFNQQRYSRLVEKYDISFCDLLTVYSSLKKFFKNDTVTINYLTERINVFIPNDILTEFNKEEDFMINAQKLFKSFFSKKKILSI